MSTPDSSYPPGQQGSSGNGGYQQGGGYPPPSYGQGQNPADGQQQPQYGQPQYGQGQGQYGQGQYGQDQYGQPQYGQGQPGQYGQPQTGQPQYQQAAYGQQQYGQAQPGYEQTQFQQAPSYAQYPQGGGYQQQAGPYGAMPQGPYMQPHAVPAGTAGYLLGGGVGFMEAVKLAFQNAFNYQGRASRSAYWWFALFSVIVSIVLEIVLVASKSAGLDILFALVSLVFFVVSLPLVIRRLHDTDRSGWWILIGLIPFIGGIVLLVFSVLEGTRGPNRFGG